MNEVSNRKNLAVVLLSGGMDSCVTCAFASKDYKLAIVHISYGQRTEEKEKECAKNICDFYKVEKRLFIKLDYLEKIGGSCLTDHNIPVPKGQIVREEIPVSYVPFRNAQFLSIATSYAEVIGAKKIFIGANETDFSGYPDCRGVFYEAFNKVIKLGTKPSSEIEITTPLINLSKTEIVKLGKSLDVPFQYSWSCYKNTRVACGECDSCLLRLKGFNEARIKDPIEYE
jgi:7-cyano-7-deazaguanine synthase